MRITKYNTRINKETKRPCLIKEVAVNYPSESLCNPEMIVHAMNRVFDVESLTEEYMHMLCMDGHGRLIGVFEISHGTVNSAIATPREIFMKALLCGAVSIILTHNHPSGYPEPSRADLETTERIKKAGEILGVKLIDHIIIGFSRYYSMMENECL